jgi:hypothetical protein
MIPDLLAATETQRERALVLGSLHELIGMLR